MVEPPTKQARQSDGAGKSSSDSLLNSLKSRRKQTASSITEFSFNKKRCRVLGRVEDVKEGAKGVLYWMSRDQRVQDNWAFLFAQRLALKNKLPLFVCFCLVPKFMDATLRHYYMLLEGLKEVEEECRSLSISFRILRGSAGSVLPGFTEENEIGAVVADFSPLKIALQWIEGVKGALDKMDVPLIQVDAHNVVPVWETSDKQEYAARTIRRKIHDRLKEFGTEFPPLVPHPHPAKEAAERIDWQALYDWLEVDESIGPVKWATPGTAAGLRVLEEFLTKRMKKYEKRNDPNEEALSNLSPWFHYGQVAPQRAILEVSLSRKANPKAADSFIEEALVRRELSDNFCFYNPRYDSIEGAADWARKTLNDHKNDVREYLYSFEEFEGSRTHDDLWNAAQIQLVREGKMHGFLRMYWAKKILEWTTSPEEALAFAIKLNDKYELDGRDPNGFVGCMWSICGIHDQGWTERPIFGKIRYMNYAGCKRKFDVVKFVNKYGAKAYPYNKGGTRKVAAGGSTSAAASTSRKRASTPAKSTAAKKAKK